MDKELDIFKKALAEAKKLVLSSQNSILHNRDNIQTRVDIISQKSIINVLQKNKISCKLYSEELETPLQFGDARYEIVLDPFDGSFIFLHEIKAFTSIALSVIENRKIKYAFVQSIADDNLYYCDPSAAFLNGKKLTCKVNEDKEPYLITGYAATKKLLKKTFAFEKLKENFYFINTGGPLLSAMVGSNNFDAAIEFSPTSFHELAGAFIAQRSGAFIETIKGGPITIDPLTKQTLITTRSKKLLRDLQAVLK